MEQKTESQQEAHKLRRGTYQVKEKDIIAMKTYLAKAKDKPEINFIKTKIK